MDSKQLRISRKSNKIKEPRGDRIFNVINITVILILSLSMVAPFLNLLAVSLSSSTAITLGKVNFIPKEFNLDSYKFVMQDNMFWSGFRNSLFITFTGTLLAMVVTTLAAYPLARSKFKGKKVVTVILVITMVFSAGLIPSYVIIKTIGIMDSPWAIILPSLVSAYNVFLVKNYFETLPESLIESAQIDGANEFQIFLKIVLPLSLPTLATVGLFFAVSYWNSYFGGMIYISTPSNMPLQTYLQGLLSLSEIPPHELPPDLAERVNAESVRAATIFAATLPILLLYPFLQKFFVKGLVVGSDK